MDAAAWRADIDVFATEFERRHKNLYHTVSRETFQKAVADLKTRVPQMQRHEIIVELMRIAAMVGDGHTSITPWRDKEIGFHILPVKFYVFEDGVYVTAAAPDQADLVGAKVESFGGVPVAEALNRVKEVIGKDNDMGATGAAPLYLAMPEVLNALKLSPKPDGAVLGLSKAGRTWTATVGSLPNDVDYPGETDIALETPEGWRSAAKSKPLWLQDIRQSYRLVELPDRKALYAQLNQVYDTKNESLAAFGARIRKLAEEKNPERVVLDIRLNRGGNGDLLPPFIREMIKLEDEDTKLFLLIGRSTWSAAQFLTDDMDKYSTAVLVGEPTASKPNAYGDSRRVTLPNSRIIARASIYWWQQNQDLTRKWTAPEVAAPLTFAEFAEGKDPVLEAALAYQPGPAPRDIFIQAAERGGVTEVRKTVDEFTHVTANRYIELERPLVLAAWEIFQRKKNDVSMGMLEYAAERYPQSFDAWNILAHVAEQSGLKDKAREANRKALEIIPTNTEALNRAERLRAG